MVIYGYLWFMVIYGLWLFMVYGYLWLFMVIDCSSIKQSLISLR